jgi:uncharacterized protein (DUF1501 family)
MSMLSRRIFIHDGFKVVSLGLAMPHIFTRAAQAAGEEAGHEPSVLHSPDQQANNPFANRTLIVVQMAGGNDGLNTVVPFNDPVYLQNRRNTGIPEDQVLKLDDRFGLHPAMGGMKSLWDQGKMSIVHGAGWPSWSRARSIGAGIRSPASPRVGRCRRR